VVILRFFFFICLWNDSVLFQFGFQPVNSGRKEQQFLLNGFKQTLS
jgi:hypothetical protein